MPSPALAQPAAGGFSEIGVRAIRLDAPLRLDGRLDEDVYQTTPPVSGFVQQERAATERTEAWVFFDGTTRSARTTPSPCSSTPTTNRRNGFLFYANPIGGFAHMQVTDEGPPNADSSAAATSAETTCRSGSAHALAASRVSAS